MEVIELTEWIALGFIPTLCAMELAWRMRRGKRTVESSSDREKAIVVKGTIRGNPIGISK